MLTKSLFATALISAVLTPGAKAAVDPNASIWD